MAVNIPVTSKPQVVIIGAGFAGMELAKQLRDADVQIVLIDKNNHHTFQPLLYQVATAGLEADSIACPVREIFRGQKNLLFRMTEVFNIRPEIKCVSTGIGDIHYDYLVIATGARTNFFGMQDIERNALSMKSIPEAIELRNIILENFERAVLTTSLEERESLMTFVIIGGGPTGVELAGALGGLRNVVLPHDHPELDFKKMNIHLVDMESRLLRGMSAQASHSVEQYFKAHNVNVWLNARVLSYDGRTVVLSGERKIPTSSLIWAAGVTGAIPGGLDPGCLAGGRIRTDSANCVLGHKDVYAIGDVACVVSEKTPKGHPMVAPVAIQQAVLLSQNLRKILLGRTTLRPFCYRDLGIMATVGRNHAVADVFFGRFQGRLAWYMWAFLHLMTIVGFRNRTIAFINWTWNYFSYDRGLRLIIRLKEKVSAQ